LESKRVALDFFVGVADGLLDVVSAAAVPVPPEVWCPLMPGVVVVGVSDEPVAVAEVASGVAPEDREDPA
jgi:hypothetical protein